MTDGSLTETDGSLTDTHGSRGQWSRRRWAAVRWILGLCWGRCDGMPLCRCAGVHVCRCAGDRGGVPIYRRATLPLISLEFPFNCSMCLLELSYDFLQLPLCLSSASFRFSKWFCYDFLWISYEFLLFVYGFLCFPFSQDVRMVFL